MVQYDLVFLKEEEKTQKHRGAARGVLEGRGAALLVKEWALSSPQLEQLPRIL